MNILAIIPARGGSKGIPRKNVRLLNGKPLLAYSIEAALRTPSITRVIVSTDDAEIGAVAQQYGAEVVWRPAEISGDTASSESALLHVLDYLAQAEGYEPELVVFLQPTSPLRQAADIQNAIATLQREQADSLFSACPYEGHIWYVNDDALLPAHNHQNRRRRQDKPEELSENGSIYVFKPWVLRQFNNRLGGKTAVYRMHVLDSFQVDSPADLEMIAQLIPIRSSSASPPDLAVLAQVRLLVLDFDGVMTDNRVLVSEDGAEAVWCDRGDGWGIARLKDAGLEVVVLSTETNPVVEQRCRKLSIECFSGQVDKLATLQHLVRQRELACDQVAYVGNDVNDLACMQWVGWPIAVADAAPEVRAEAKLLTRSAGGHGAVREVADWILSVSESRSGYQEQRMLDGSNAKDSTLLEQEGIRDALLELSQLAVQVAELLGPQIERAAQLILSCIMAGNKVLICGNGGSAADAQHFAAELVGKMCRERRALPAISLAVDPSTVTALGNDYGFDQVFARQVEGLGKRGDLLLLISTSGRSANVLEAAKVARASGLRTIALVGQESDPLVTSCDVCIHVPSPNAQRVQEMHTVILHLICEYVEIRI